MTVSCAPCVMLGFGIRKRPQELGEIALDQDEIGCMWNFWKESGIVRQLSWPSDELACAPTEFQLECQFAN